MRHLTKKGILLFAVVMVSAALVAPAMASAATWNIGGTPVTGAVAVTGTGDLTLGPTLGNTLSCHITSAGTVSPAGADSITSLTFSTCSTSIGAACTPNVSATLGTLPWASQLNGTSPLRDTITGISFIWTYGASCGVFAGQTLTATGTLNPAITNTAGVGVDAALTTTSGSLTTTFGSATVIGTIAIMASSGVLSATP
jgi:hypothetical protein